MAKIFSVKFFWQNFCQKKCYDKIFLANFSFGEIVLGEIFFRQNFFFLFITYFWWIFFFSKYFLLAKFFWSIRGKSIFVKKKIMTKLFFGKNFFGKIFLSEFFFGENSFLKIFFSWKFFYQDFFDFLWQLEYVQDGPRNLSLKFGQNRVSDSWDIPDMDKCHKDKCCLNKCHCDSWNMFKKVAGTYH